MSQGLEFLSQPFWVIFGHIWVFGILPLGVTYLGAETRFLDYLKTKTGSHEPGMKLPWGGGPFGGL